mgnify:FL=1
MKHTSPDTTPPLRAIRILLIVLGSLIVALSILFNYGVLYVASIYTYTDALDFMVHRYTAEKMCASLNYYYTRGIMQDDKDAAEIWCQQILQDDAFRFGVGESGVSGIWRSQEKSSLVLPEQNSI